VNEKDAFITALGVLGATFDRRLSPPAIEGYWLALKDLTEQEFAAATERAVKSCKFMPAPSELLTLAGRGRNVEAEIAKAWDYVRRAVDQHDYTVRSIDFGPRVNACLRNMGGWDRLCQMKVTELDVWARKEFERLYVAFSELPSEGLHGEALRGAFPAGGDVQVKIPGQPEQRPQLESPGRSEITKMIRDLADGKEPPF
jgi:hypothetical protein